jgi:6-phosphogluconate dehydrogenase
MGMQLGFVGLGKMGLNMVTRLARSGHDVVAFDRNADAVARGTTAGARGVSSLDALVEALAPPRAIWVMVPAGEPTESTVTALGQRLMGDDVIIDGGNTNFHDDIRRAGVLATRRIHYVDAGTSGGIWGLEEGYCLMLGGDPAVCRRLEPIFSSLAPPEGYLRVGDHGAGHYVKMIHNGIEYGLMQAYAEGFELMHASSYDIDLAGVASLWLRGSVPSKATVISAASTPMSRTPARDAGPCRKASSAASRFPPSPRRSSPGFARATTARSAIGYWPRCGSNSEDMR